MELQDSVLKEFADAVNNKALIQPSDSQHLYATVGSNITDDLVYVRLNGSEIDTPARSLVEVGVGDVVMCTMRGHTLTIIGNVSYPALTRVGPVYMTLTAEGLLIGKLSSENKPIDGYIIVGTNGSSIYDIDGNMLAAFGTNGSSIYDVDGNMLATFGTTAQIGMTNTSHVVTTSTGVEIRNGSNKILADFTANGITLRDSTGTAIASFSATSVEIGKSTLATVSFCGGKAVIVLDGTTLRISGGNSVEAIGMSNSYNNYRSEVVCETKNNSQRAAIQLLNGSNTITSILLSNDGVNVTVPSGKAITENGIEVAKVNDVFAYGTVTWTAPDSTLDTMSNYRVYEATINIPTGYYLAGISRIYTNNISWGVREFDANWNTKKLVVKLVPNDGSLTRIPKVVAARWFAIRTSGVKAGGDTNIDF